MEKTFLLFIVNLCCFYSVLAECGNQSVVLTSNSPRGNSHFTFITQSAANITLEFRCYSRGSIRLDLFWLNPGENATTGRKLWSLFSDEYGFYFFNEQHYRNDTTRQSEGMPDGFRVFTTIANIDSSHNNSEFLLQFRSNPQLKKWIHLDVVCCRAISIPSYLNLSDSWIGENLNCLAGGSATCKSGEMFMTGRINDYRASIDLKCNAYGRWDYVEVECTSSCPPPSYSPRLSAKLSARYPRRFKLGEKMSLGCSYGRMYSTIPPINFFDDIEITCQANENWTSADVACWRGQTIDFSTKEIFLIYDQPTIAICQSSNPLSDCKINAGEKTTERKGNAWMNLTFSSLHHGMTIECQITDQGGKVTTNQTKLNIWFAPLMVEGNTKYELVPGRSGRVVVELLSNPKLWMKDIQVVKNETELLNYYLTVDGVKHKIVVDFLEVDVDDFGSYAVSVASHLLLESPLVYNFSIVGTKASLTTSEAINVTLGVILALTLIALAVFIALKKLSNSNVSINRGNETTPIDQTKDIHNYEEIENKTGGDGTGAPQRQNVSYTNIDSRSTAQTSTAGDVQMYEIPIGSKKLPANLTVTGKPYESVYDN